MEDSDSVAVARVKSGDGEAYRGVVERQSRSGFRLAFRMTGSEPDAEDVVQETFMRAYKQLHRWEARSSFSTWLYRIAANYSLDLVRRRKRHAEVGLEESRGNGEEAGDVLRALPTSEPGPERLLISSNVQAQVSQTLSELSQQERTGVVLRHFGGQSIEGMSGALGLSANAAKHSIFRAGQKLRRALEPLVGEAS